MNGNRISYTPGDLAAALANGAALLGVQPAAAALQARAILQDTPRNTAALRLLARALALLGEHDKAREARAPALAFAPREPDVAEAHRALSEGHFDQVEQILQARVAAEPDEPVALLLLGEAAARSGRFGEAAQHLRRALEFAPEYEPARMALARALYRRFEPREALAALEAAPADTRDQIANHRFRATLLAELGRYASAEGVLRALVNEQPSEPGLLIQHGDMFRTLGDKSSAEQAYRRAIVAAPNLGRAWWALAALDVGVLGREDDTTLTALHSSTRDPDDRMHLAFALGRLRDHQRAYESAFALFSEANSLHRDMRPWDRSPFMRRTESLIEALDRGLLTDRRGSGESGSGPVFIVGLARSGSTLLEQMLSRHSAIAAGGELPVIPALLREAAATRRLDPETDIVALLEGLSSADAAELGAEYLRRARQRCPGTEAHFTDKLPHNWAELAFIRLILPNARIIDMRRDLADCAVSNFTLLFAPGHPASYELEDFVAYAQAYVSGTAAFARNAPGALHGVQYEELVTSPERVLREVLAHLGLPFEEACLDFARSDRGVATASAEQVRQPLTTSAVGSWRRFASWLGPVPDNLARIAAA